MTHLLFSYGTLRLPAVQLALYGAEVSTTADALPGFRLEWITITDPAVVATSGTDRHPILVKGGEGDAVPGAVLELSDADLAATDDYEVDDYHRELVTLASSRSAWVYLGD
jgi:hypothetical protein